MYKTIAKRSYDRGSSTEEDNIEPLSIGKRKRRRRYREDVMGVGWCTVILESNSANINSIQIYCDLDNPVLVEFAIEEKKKYYGIYY